MKNLNVTAYEVEELSELQMREIDGGIVPLLIVGACILLGASSCAGTKISVTGEYKQAKVSVSVEKE